MPRERAISEKPRIILVLRMRPLLFPNLRIFREDILVRAELIGTKLRDPEAFADYATGTIFNVIFDRLLRLRA